MSARKDSSENPPWAGRRSSLGTTKFQKKTPEKIRLVNGKYLCLVTGAGNGFGRTIAGLVFQDQGIFPIAMAGSKVILVDNDFEGLKETSGKKMRQFLMHRKINVELKFVDLNNLNDARNMLNEISSAYEKDFEHVILFNNASSVGDVTKDTIAHTDDTTIIQEYWDLNITSRMYVTSQFCNIFHHSRKTIVHTASYDSSVPTSYLGLSCMATSAIDTFGQVFAKENPTVHVLHYTPSRMDTKPNEKHSR